MFHAVLFFFWFRPELWPTPPAQVETTQSYTLEEWNDEELAAYPPPPPVHVVTSEFDVTTAQHEETVIAYAPALRNLSITLENTGTGRIKSPYLFGPHGWDFRSLKAIAEAITKDVSLTEAEKFIRIHEWKGLHVMTVLGGSYAPYEDEDFSANPLRILNQYGHAMCGQSTSTLNALLRAVPPAGSMYGRKVKINDHRTGEAYWDGGWHAFDTTPGTGVVQWVYYDAENQNIAPSWKYLLQNQQLLARTKGWSGFTLTEYQDVSTATGETFAENVEDSHWDFNYDLRPNESITMHFDMRGRLDLTSARQDNSKMYRCYSDYGSAVFTYKPDFTNALYKKYAVSEQNVRQTATGLIPVNPAQPSSIIFPIHSTWCFAGADIVARFRTGGKVYIAVNDDPYDTRLPATPSWQLLSTSQKEYSAASIEGKMIYWVKCEFQGLEAGLRTLEISSEVQMSPWSMPGLEYGSNRIRFEAADMDRSTLHVTYRYDDKSPFHSYEPATSDFGRHIPIRVGGVLQQGSKKGYADYRKGRFWLRLAQTPDEKVNVLVEIFKVSGEDAGSRVRTLVKKPLRYGWYTFYWDGTDDGGRRLPVGMYCYKLSINGAVVHGERLYLYSEIWPVPNERLKPPPPTLEAGAAALPAEPKVGETVWFDLKAKAAATEKLTYAWDFGDGSTGSGPAPKHAYVRPGVYVAFVVVTDEHGGSTASSVTVHVIAPPVPPAAPPPPATPPPPSPTPPPAAEDDPPAAGDAHGAGVPPPSPPADDHEGDAEPSPEPAEPPAPQIPQPEPTVLPLIVRAVSGTARFDVPRVAGRSRPDSCRVSGSLVNVPAGWSPEGKTIVADVGGVAAQFTLDRRGRASTEAGSIRLRIKRKRHEFLGGTIPFTLRLKGDLANEWRDEGIDPGMDEKDEPLDMTIEFRLDGSVYSTIAHATLDSAARRRATFRFRQ